MSKVTFEFPIAEVTGKINRYSHVSHRTTFGKKHTYTWNPDTEIKTTPKRLIHRLSLSMASKRASQELADAEIGAMWRKKWEEEGGDGPLVSFVIHKVHPEIKAQLTEEWADRPMEELEQYAKRQGAKQFRAK